MGLGARSSPQLGLRRVPNRVADDAGPSLPAEIRRIGRDETDRRRCPSPALRRINLGIVQSLSYRAERIARAHASEDPSDVRDSVRVELGETLSEVVAAGRNVAVWKAGHMARGGIEPPPSHQTG